MRSVGLPFRWRNPERRSRPVTTRRALLTTVLSLVPLAVGCGGANSACPADASACGAAGGPSNETGATSVAAGGQFRGDGSPMPSWGGWAWGSDPADAIAKAGFDWFETGYPGDTGTNDTLRNAGVRPFAYINL